MAIFSGLIALATTVGSFIAGATGITGFILKTALAVGLSYAAQALAGKPKQQANPPFSLQGSIRASGAIARSFMCGKGMTAGSLAYANTWGPENGTPNSYLVQVIALSDLPVKGLSEVWVNGQKVMLLTGDPDEEMGFPVSEYRKDGQDYLWIKFCDGTQTGADEYLVDRFEEDSTYPYEDTRVGVGVAYVICTARVNETLFTGFPEYKFVVESVPFYDPSQDTTAGGDGSQLWGTPSTWGGDGDDLPIVQAYNIVRGLTYGSEWFYGLQNISASQIPDAEWIEAIEVCRSEVEGPDGNEPQYRCGGEVLVSARIADTIEALLTSCQGRLSEIGGFYKPHAGAPGTADGSFTDGDIISTSPQTFTPFHGLADTINGIAGKYPEPEEGWNVKSAPTRLDPDFEAQDGGRRLLADVDYSMVPYKAQVQRLMESALLEARRARRHTLSLPPLFWKYEPGDILEWTSERNGYEAKLFRIDGMTDLANLDVLVDITEVDNEDYDWDHETDYVPPVDGPVGISRPQPQPIIDWFAEPYIIEDSGANPRRAAIKLSWDGSVDDVEAVEYEVRLDGETEVILNGRTDRVSVGALIISQNLLPDEDYEVRGRYIPRSDRDTLWSDWLDVTTPSVPDVEIPAEVYARMQTVEELGGRLRTLDLTMNEIAGAVAILQTLLEEDRGQINQGIAARYEQNKASAELALQGVATNTSALAQFLVGLVATTGAGTAEVLARFVALSDTGGLLARAALQVRAEYGSAWAAAALELGVVSTPSGLQSIAILSGDQVYLKVGDVNIPAYGLQRGDEAKETPLVYSATEDLYTITVDLTEKHKTFTATLDNNADIRFPVGAWVGAEFTLIVEQESPGGNELTYDTSTFIVGDELQQPSASPGVYSVYKGTVISLNPPVASLKLDLFGATTSSSEAIFSIDPPVGGKSVWNLLVDGPLEIDGPVAGAADITYTIIPLGIRLDCTVEIWGCGGTSGSVVGVTATHPANPADASFHDIVAGSGKSTQSLFLINGVYTTTGGDGGDATGGDTNESGDNGAGGGATFPYVRTGASGAAPDGGAAQPEQFIIGSGGNPTGAAGLEGNSPGGGAGGAGYWYSASGYYNSTGGAGGSSKATKDYDEFDSLLQDTEYEVVLPAPKVPITSTLTPVNGVPPTGAPGGRSRIRISALS